MPIEDDSSGYDKLMHELKELDHLAIEIGIFGDGGDYTEEMIANVQEFGMTIKAKKNYMVIPLAPKYKGVDPKSLDLFYLKTKEGTAYLCRNKGKDQIEFCYMLAKQVTVPERSFLRSTFDEQNEKWTDFFERQIELVCSLEITAKQAYSRLGTLIVGDVQKKMRNLRDPKLSPITVAGRQKHSTNPLMDTGHLRAAVTWKVVRDNADV